jgi:hypothetical protein
MRSAARLPGTEREAARLPSGHGNRLPVTALPVRHMGQVRLSLKAEGRAATAGVIVS